MSKTKNDGECKVRIHLVLISKKSFNRQTPLLYFYSKLKQMGQSMSSVFGQLTSLSRSSTLVTSPTTPLSPQTEQMIQSE